MWEYEGGKISQHNGNIYVKDVLEWEMVLKYSSLPSPIKTVYLFVPLSNFNSIMKIYQIYWIFHQIEQSFVEIAGSPTLRSSFWPVLEFEDVFLVKYL